MRKLETNERDEAGRSTIDEEIGETVKALRRAVGVKVGSIRLLVRERGRGQPSVSGTKPRADSLNRSYDRALTRTARAELLVGEVLYRRHRPGHGTIRACAAPANLPLHLAYRIAGVRKGPTVSPLEHQAGSIDRGSESGDGLPSAWIRPGTPAA